MRKEDHRIVLAGNALQGLLASQDTEQGWPIDALAVVSLKIADAVLHYNEKESLPELIDSRKTPEQEPSAIVTQPTIITP